MIEHVFSLILRTVQVGGKTDLLMVLTKHVLVAECEKNEMNCQLLNEFTLIQSRILNIGKYFQVS